MPYLQEPRQLKDYDVLGVAACRREYLLADNNTKILLTHSYLIPETHRIVYEAILEETLLWLKPQEVRQGNSDDFLQVLLEDFRREFPKTSSYLKLDLTEVMRSYLSEFPWQGPLLSGHFRYFPIFLKRTVHDSDLYLIAQKEWFWSYLSFADFGLPSHEQGRILLNPSLQSLYCTSKVEEVELTPGLTFFYYDYSLQRVREYKGDPWDAIVVDLLHEDRKYSLDQLIEQALMMKLEVSLSRQEWLKKFFYLKSEGILLESDSRKISNLK